MKVKQQGFTLIELVIVIVILGILAAVAVPKFTSMSGEAGDASAQGVAASLSSASSMNLGKFVASSGTSGYAVTATTTCANLATNLLSGGALPTGVSFVAGTNTLTGCTAQGASDSTRCMVKHSSGATSGGFPVVVMCTGA